MTWTPLDPGSAPPSIPEFGDFEEPDYEFPTGGIAIPEWVREQVREGYGNLYNQFSSKLGFDKIVDMMRIPSGSPDFLIYVENPIRNFSGIELPSFRKELDLNELARQSWVPMLRMMLLFIVVFMFISSVITVLRQA